MKKLALTATIILGLAIGAMAQGGGLFQRGGDMIESNNNYRTTNSPMLPTTHGMGDDQSADTTPLGSGIAVLTALGAAYALGKKRKEK